MIHTINRSKWGNCNSCSATNTAVVKVAKDLVCLRCRNTQKVKLQITRANQRNAIRRLGTAQEISQEQRERISEQEKWFDIIAKEIDHNPMCWECGGKIYKPYYRAATAHIFAKSIFPSIATHPLNYLVLSANCGCHNKTHRLDTFSRMRIFKEACDRFKEFEPFITEKHKYIDEFKRYADLSVDL